MQPYLDKFVIILDRLKELHSESGKFSKPELPEKDLEFSEDDLEMLLEYFPKLQMYLHYTELPPIRIVDENLHDYILSHVRLYNMLNTSREDYYKRQDQEYTMMTDRMDYLVTELESVDNLYR